MAIQIQKGGFGSTQLPTQGLLSGAGKFATGSNAPIQQKASAQVTAPKSMGVQSTPIPQPQVKTSYSTPTPVIQTPANNQTSSQQQQYNPAQQSANVSNVGILTQLANQQNAPYQQTAGSNIEEQKRLALQNQQYADRARQIADEAGKRMAEVGRMGNLEALGLSEKGTTRIAEGNSLGVKNTAANIQNAIANAANMQLAGNAQGLTAQQQAMSGIDQATGNAFTGQGLIQSALGTVAGYTQPTSNIILRNPQTGEVIGNQNLSQLAAMQGSLSGTQSSANDLTQKIATIDSQSGAVNAAAQSLQQYASLGGLNKNVPLISAFQQKLGSSFVNSPEVAGLTAKIMAVNTLYQQVTGIPGTLDPNTMTVDQLNTKLQSMLQDIQNSRLNAEKTLGSLRGGASSVPQGGSTGGSGGLYDF